MRKRSRTRAGGLKGSRVRRAQGRHRFGRAKSSGERRCPAPWRQGTGARRAAPRPRSRARAARRQRFPPPPFRRAKADGTAGDARSSRCERPELAVSAERALAPDWLCHCSILSRRQIARTRSTIGPRFDLSLWVPGPRIYLQPARRGTFKPGEIATRRDKANTAAGIRPGRPARPHQPAKASNPIAPSRAPRCRTQPKRPQIGRNRSPPIRPHNRLICRHFRSEQRDCSNASHARGRWFETSRAHHQYLRDFSGSAGSCSRWMAFVAQSRVYGEVIWSVSVGPLITGAAEPVASVRQEKGSMRSVRPADKLPSRPW